MATERGVVRRLHDTPRRTAMPSAAPRRRYLVPVNDNRPPLPVRLRRPMFLAVLVAVAVFVAVRWFL